MKPAREDNINFQATPKRLVLKELYSNNQRLILSICSLCVFFSLWEWIGQSGLINPLFTSSPSRITREAERVFFQTGEMWQNLRLSGFEYATGLSLAIIVGVSVGVLMGWYRTLESLFDVYITALYATPQVAFTSLLIIWFGIGVLPRMC